MATVNSAAGQGEAAVFTLEVTEQHWLTEHTFEIRFRRPGHFAFLPGQKIGFSAGSLRRDYTLLGPAEADFLSICVRHIPGGRFSPRLAAARKGDRFAVTAPFGYFSFRPSARPAIWIATGTGIAPFVAFARAGVQGFDLLHGVRALEDLYYREELARVARRYVPCISGPVPKTRGDASVFAGHVGVCLADRWPSRVYDFYLCGRGDMIRDVLAIIDHGFEGSHVFTERFH